MAESGSHYRDFAGDFDAKGAAEVLGVRFHARRDATGQRYVFPLPTFELAVRTDAGTAEVSAEHAHLVIDNVSRYSLGPNRVVLEHEERALDEPDEPDEQDVRRMRLRIQQDGFSYYPVLTGPLAADAAPAGQTVSTGASRGPDAATGRPGPSSGVVRTPERPPGTVKITGNVGYGPLFENDGQVRSGSFALAEKVEGRTTWHNHVLVFGPLADELAEAHQQGQMGVGARVIVTGRHATGHVQSESGRMRTRKEFHADEFRILKPPRKRR